MSSAETSAAEVRPDWLALAAAVVTAVLLFTPVADTPGSVFIGGACLFWAGFVIAWSRRDRAAFRRWGFRADNLCQASALTGAAFAAAAAALAGYAAVRGTLRFPLHALPLFLVYPLWGLTQQFLMLGVVARHLERVGGLGRRPAALVVVVALLFGLLHLFNLRLVVGTFLLELVAVPLYLRHRNLWPLGVAHGWLGGLFYLWVEGRDLWAERFG